MLCDVVWCCVGVLRVLFGVGLALRGIAWHCVVLTDGVLMLLLSLLLLLLLLLWLWLLLLLMCV